MKTAARNVARTAVALAAVGVIAILNGCGAAPDGGEEAPGKSQEAWSTTSCNGWSPYSINVSDSFEAGLAHHNCTVVGAHTDAGGTYGANYAYKIVKCYYSQILVDWTDYQDASRNIILSWHGDTCTANAPARYVYLTWDPRSLINDSPVCPNGCMPPGSGI